MLGGMIVLVLPKLNTIVNLNNYYASINNNT